MNFLEDCVGSLIGILKVRLDLSLNYGGTRATEALTHGGRG